MYDKERERDRYEKDRAEKQKERDKIIREKEREILDRERTERERLKEDKDRLDRLKAERDRIDREMERLNRDREKLDKTKSKLESKSLDKKTVDKVIDRSKPSSKDSVRPELKKNIDLNSQNTYRIDKKLPGKPDSRYLNGHSSQGKPVPKQLPQKDGTLLTKKVDGSQKMNGHARPENGKRPLDAKGAPGKRPDDRRTAPQAGPSKPNISNTFDFDKHVSNFKSKQFPTGDVKRKRQQIDDRKKNRRK